ncbi:MAG: peptide chain release factor 1 [SAR324 cluster bacterium]|nr:peptide chain release factor 1 [SAR324 cluster bacterium]
MLNKLTAIKERFEKLNVLLSQPDVHADQQRYQALTKEHSDIAGIVEVFDKYTAIEKNLAGNREILGNSQEDPEMRSMAEQEIPALEEELNHLEQQIKFLLIPKDPDDARDTIIEIRAGTGGDEAALFARDLFRMYIRFAELNGWRYEVIDESPTDIGGFKEIIVSIHGKDVYSHLKFEGGVHRVQRIPKTETQGRVHTSASTVAVLPDVDEVEIDINPEDLRIDVFRSSGPGGQSVNTTDSAVRVTHIPSGLVVTCQNEKSQLKNKNQAIKVLRARLYDLEMEAQLSETSEQRRMMVGKGDRSERIRTYNFPQGRLTDHRINLTLYQLEHIMEGYLHPVVEALRTNYQAELLKGSDE